MKIYECIILTIHNNHKTTTNLRAHFREICVIMQQTNQEKIHKMLIIQFFFIDKNKFSIYQCRAIHKIFLTKLSISILKIYKNQNL